MPSADKLASFLTSEREQLVCSSVSAKKRNLVFRGQDGLVFIQGGEETGNSNLAIGSTKKA